jgi:hypothetical protein
MFFMRLKQSRGGDEGAVQCFVTDINRSREGTIEEQI